MRQIELSGRDPLPFMTPDEQAIEELIEELVNERPVDPIGLYRALTQDGEQITVGKAFFNSDLPPMSPDARRELLRQLFKQTMPEDSKQDQ
jgi:hypothetical protein